MPIKASRDEGLRGMDTNLGVDRRKPLECSVDEGLSISQHGECMPVFPDK